MNHAARHPFRLGLNTSAESAGVEPEGLIPVISAFSSALADESRETATACLQDILFQVLYAVSLSAIL